MDTLREELAKLIQQIKDAYADRNITAGEALGLLVKSVSAFAVLARQIMPAIESGELRQFVIDGVQQVYDQVIAPMDIPGIPNIIEDTIDDAIGRAVPTFIGLAYDTILQVFKIGQGDQGGGDPVLLLALPPRG